MTIQSKINIAEYEKFIARHSERRFELIFGEIVEKMPTLLHAYIVALMTTFLMNYVRENALGWVLVEARYRLPDDDGNDRIPDLSFVSHEKGDLVGSGPAPYMPELAVEVQSPGQSDRHMTDRAAYYLAHGTRMVWLIYPEKRLVEVLTTDDRQLLTRRDMLAGGNVLPGFTVAVSDIFPAEIEQIE